MPEIIESDGDIFASGCEALVNPVDCTGAQGKGLALEFKRRYPAQCRWFKAFAGKGLAKPGAVYRSPYETAPEFVLFATTKMHWRHTSSLRIVQSCCGALVDVVADLEIRSIGIPALGCGEGRLAWPDVRLLIMAAAKRMTCERVVVFGPKERRR